MKHNIRNIIFDLGGVLIDWNPRYLYSQLFRTELAVDYFLERVTTFEWNEEQDAGRSIDEANQLLIGEFPEYTNEIKAYYGRWEEDMLGDAHSEVVHILHHFVNHPLYGVFALTNWSAETFPLALKKFEFLSWFEGILVSGEEGVKKPDPEIFHRMLSRFDLEARECIFIDDNLRNVEAATKFGIKGIHFKNSEQLIMQLKEKGLDI